MATSRLVQCPEIGRCPESGHCPESRQGVDARMAQRSGVRPGPRRSLTEGDILAAAVGLLDRGGADALSMRAVAAAVGVAPNALYTYFRTKTSLLHAVTDELLGQVDRGLLPDPARPWRDRLARYAARGAGDVAGPPGVGTAPAELAARRPARAGGGGGAPRRPRRRRPHRRGRGPGVLPAHDLRARRRRIRCRRPRTDTDPSTTTPARPLDVRPSRSRPTYPRAAAEVEVIAAYNSAEQYLWGLHRLLDGLDSRGVGDVPTPGTHACPGRRR